MGLIAWHPEACEAYEVSDAWQLDGPIPETVLDVMLPDAFGKRVAFSAISSPASTISPDCSRGEIVVDGKNIARLSLRSAASYRRLQVGIIFQAYNLLPQLTAIQNVALPMMAAGRLDMRRAEQLLRSVGLGDRALHCATELSGGEQQRVAIARALADEPTGNLEENAREVLRLLTQSCKERHATLMLATHDVRSFEGADRVFALQSGLLREERFPSV